MNKNSVIVLVLVVAVILLAFIFKGNSIKRHLGLTAPTPTITPAVSVAPTHAATTVAPQKNNSKKPLQK